MTMAKDTQVYAFDINKVDEIFDLLLKDGLLNLTKGQIILSKEVLANKEVTSRGIITQFILLLSEQFRRLFNKEK